MLILATDMARHSEIVENFKSKLSTFDFKNEDYLNSVSKQVSNENKDVYNLIFVRVFVIFILRSRHVWLFLSPVLCIAAEDDSCQVL